ncbi:MAG: hypothetical protein MUF15_03945 [Acidobacteria bacterium]|jgi:hypothetical protein|nr:hypothetical protein [Acidobacteriota bacterium]
MDAIITKIKASGNLLLNLNNQLIPPDAPVWQMDADKAVEGAEAAMFPAAFALDDPESAELDVKMLFPNGDTGEDYRLTLLFNNNIPLFSGNAQPADKNEKNSRRFTLALQYRPQGFFKVHGTEMSWRLVNENTGETLELPPHPFELYWLFEDSGDLFQRGVSVEVLRDFTCHLEGEGLPNNDHDGPIGHAPEKIMASVVTWLFNRVPPRYDIAHGRPHFTRVCGRLEFSILLTQYLSAPDDPGHWCNCYDMATIVQAFLRLIGIKGVEYVYLKPFGYLKKTQLIGRGECNNPFYDIEKNGPVVAEDDPARSYFNNHVFCITPGGMILDACAGPHTGTETLDQYLANAIDPIHPAGSDYKTGTPADACKGIGVTMVDQTAAPEGLPDLPLVKPFMDKLGISVSGFTGGCDKYVVYSWPDPLHCPFLSDQPRELFYSGLIHGQKEVFKTWKLKQKDKGERIKINIHIFSGKNKTSALYRFIELGSAGSAAELLYEKGEPGLGQYSAQTAAPGINRRYFWVYYNMIVDIVYHNSEADVGAVNKWFQQQAESHLKESIDADLPSVDDILCDNLTPKAGETVTVSMKPSPNISHDFFVDGQGLRLRQAAPDRMSFLARKVGDVKLGILAVDKNTLLMKTKEFDIKAQ